MFRGFDGGFGGVAFVEVADREDDARGVEADEVPGRFKAEAAVRAGDDDGLAGEFLGRVGGCEAEVGVDDVGEETHWIEEKGVSRVKGGSRT